MKPLKKPVVTQPRRMTQLMMEVNFQPNEQEMYEVFKLMDRDKKGYVDKDDLLTIAKLKNNTQGLVSMDEKIELLNIKPVKN